jgi:hypothetical protein
LSTFLDQNTKCTNHSPNNHCNSNHADFATISNHLSKNKPSELALSALFIVPLYKGASNTSAQFGNEKRLNAYDYWLRELSIKDERTIYQYRHYFNKYLSFLNTTSDKLLEHRQTTIKNEDIKIQRTHESCFLDFLKHLKDKSFYEMHFYPLRTRRRDYPKSTPNGARRATTSIIIEMLEKATPQNKSTFKALVMTLKDTGLRVTDLMNLNCNIILENWNKNLIMFTIRTEKTDI